MSRRMKELIIAVAQAVEASSEDPMLHRSPLLLTVIAVAIVALGGAALATPPVGQTTELLARGSAGRLHAKHDGIRVASRRGVAADVAVATITFPPGGSSGWHHHPGVVLVVVRSGTVTFYDRKCRSEVHNAGDAFVESSNSPGLAKNNGTDNAVVDATFIVPTSSAKAAPTPLRLDDPQPKRCNVS
jgi:quercetin dioxygenase-like cupin family protein